MMKRYVRDQFVDPTAGRCRGKTGGGDKGGHTSTDQAATNVNPPAPLASSVERGFYSEDSDSDSGIAHNRRSGGSAFGRSEPEKRFNVVPEQGSIFMGKEVSIDYDSTLDADHKLILSSSLALLKSRNSAVVLAVCALHFYCGIVEPNSLTATRISKAMIRILRNRREIQFAVLTAIKAMVIEAPWIFYDYAQDFYVRSDDPQFNRVLKLDILTALCTNDNSEALCRELQTYVKDSNNKFVVASVQAVAKVAEKNTDLLSPVLNGLLTLLLCHRNPSVLDSAASALRHLLQIGFALCSSFAENTADSIKFLEDSATKKLKKKQKRHKRKEQEDSETLKKRQLLEYCENILRDAVRLILVPEHMISTAVARANIVWMAGEYHSVFIDIAQDILRLLALEFVNEEACVKKEILVLAIKCSMRCPEDQGVEELMTYVLELSRYDASTDVRDMARLMTAVCGLASGDDGSVDPEALENLAERASRIMLAQKVPPKVLLNSAYSMDAAAMWNGDDNISKMLFTIDSISALTGYTVSGYSVLPDWSQTPSDSSLRDKTYGSSIESMDKGSKSSFGRSSIYSKDDSMDDAHFYDDDDDENIRSTMQTAEYRPSRREKTKYSSSSATSSSYESDDSVSTSSSSASPRVSQKSSHSRNRHIMDTRESSSSDSDSTSESSSSSSDSQGSSDLIQIKAGLDDLSVLDKNGGINYNDSSTINRRAGVRRVARTAASTAGRNRHKLETSGTVNLLDEVMDDFTEHSNASANINKDFPSNISSELNLLEDMSSNTGPYISGSDIYDVGKMVSASDTLPQSQFVDADLPEGTAATDSSILSQILDSFPAAKSDTSMVESKNLQSVSVVAPTNSMQIPEKTKSAVVEEVRSVSKQILNPDLASGLSISLSFRHGVKPSKLQGIGVKCVLIKYKNCGREYAIR